MAIEDMKAPIGLQQNITSRHYNIREGYILLEYIEGTSNKFWCAIPDGDGCITAWGRNGRPPQGSKHINFYKAERKIEEKLNEGYEIIKENKLLKAFFEAPEWFEKVEGTEDFKASIKARIIGISLEQSLPPATSTKTKFKI